MLTRLLSLFLAKQIEAKKAVPREEMAIRGLKTKKVFVGGLPMSIGEDEFREYFERFGSVTDAQIMLERDTGRPRGSLPLLSQPFNQ